MARGNGQGLRISAKGRCQNELKSQNDGCNLSLFGKYFVFQSVFFATIGNSALIW